MASLGLWTLPFYSLARISPTFCIVASLPIESTPPFSSVGISTEWVLYPLQRLPLQQRYDRGLLLVAVHVAHGRQPWTPCRRRCTSELCTSRLSIPDRVGTRREVRLVGPALCRLKLNSAKEPTQASTTRPVRSAVRQLAVRLPASCSAFD